MTHHSLVRVSALLSLLFATTPGAAATRAPVAALNGPYVPGQVIVKFKPGVTAAARDAALKRRASAVAEEVHGPDTILVGVTAGQSVEAAVAAYQDDPAVEYAQPNFVYRIQATPNDPSYGQLWGLKNTGQTITNAFRQPIGSPLLFDERYPGTNPGVAGADIRAEEAWNAITDCSSVTVAVLDTGVNYDHVDLAANMWSSVAFPKHGFNFVDGKDDPMDDNGHGTHAAGTIGAAGNNGVGVTGVCWKASIMAVKVLDLDGGGDTAHIIQGIDFAVANGARVLNMSLGGPDLGDRAYGEAVTRAQLADVVLVAAAGNAEKDNDERPEVPCNFRQPNVICVAALDQKNGLAGFSNYGARSVMLAAPGANILSTWNGESVNLSYPVSDPLSPGWSTSTTTSGGWGYRAVPTSKDSVACLADPATYPSGTYRAGTDDRAWKALPVGKVDRAELKYVIAGSMAAGDALQVAYRAGAAASDPFDGGKVLLSYTNSIGSDDDLLESSSFSWDVDACISSPACTVGFRLTSAAGSTGKGVAIGKVRVETFTRNTTSYDTVYGTSMAAPHVAGVVTMLRAFNPRYGYADVVAAVKAGGRSLPSLAGKTITGKALDAIGTISHLEPITGVTATVQ